MLTINGKNPETITIGGNAVESIAIQGEIVWQIGADITPYFYIKNLYNGSNTITLKRDKGNNTSFPSYNIEYSTDNKTTWTSVVFDANEELNITLNDLNDLVFFRSTTGWNSLGLQGLYRYTFNGSQNHTIGGDLRTLLDYSDATLSTTPEYCFSGVFTNDVNLVDASRLDFSHLTTLRSQCYTGMFYGCQSLVSIPTLPATNLADSCYRSMFSGCQLITSMPQLPATTLADNCYAYMFENCLGLNTVSQLPATTLAQYCYQGMFKGCQSLVNTPQLPATTLATSCYQAMYQGCIAIITPEDLPATTLANNCYTGMYLGCTGMTSIPNIAATNIPMNGLAFTFSGCTSLQSVDVRNITTIYSDQNHVNSGMQEIFRNCSSLNEVWAPNVTTWDEDATYNWLDGVAASGVVLKDNNLTIPLNSTSGVPTDWTTQSNIFTLLAYIHKDTLTAYQDFRNPYDEWAINTGIKPTQNMSWRVKGQSKGLNNGAIVAGSSGLGNFYDWRFFAYQNHLYYDLVHDRWTGQSMGTNIDWDLTFTNYSVYDNISQRYLFQGTPKTIQNIEQFTPIIADIATWWLKSIEIFDDNGNTVFNGVAGESNGVIGLYDLVNNQLITNSYVTLTGEPIT